MTMTRTRFGGLFIASNRLPFVVSLEGGKVSLESSTGGLVAARSPGEPRVGRFHGAEE